MRSPQEGAPILDDTSKEAVEEAAISINLKGFNARTVGRLSHRRAFGGALGELTGAVLGEHSYSEAAR